MKEFLDLQKIGNVPVEDIKELDTEELFAKDVELRLPDVKLEEKEWGILNSLHQLLTFGTLREFQVD